MQLADYDCTQSIEVWAEISKNKKPPEEVQEMLCSLMYLPSAERITLSIVKARNLFKPSDKQFIGRCKAGAEIRRWSNGKNLFRPVHQSLPHRQRQAHQKEKVQLQERHLQPGLERGFDIQHAIHKFAEFGV